MTGIVKRLRRPPLGIISLMPATVTGRSVETGSVERGTDFEDIAFHIERGDLLILPWNAVRITVTRTAIRRPHPASAVRN